MRSIVILCRHGDTFEKGEKVVMVGANEDLPLTERGLSQGRAVGDALSSCGVVSDLIITGPLQRTRIFAEIISAKIGCTSALCFDDRLKEFDYGSWSGLSTDEIVTLAGQDAWQAWNERSVRPEGTTFTPSQEQARLEARELLGELAKRTSPSIVVTSNGRLREIGRVVVAGEGAFKVRTGHSCILVREPDKWVIWGWDLDPAALAQGLQSC